jgi:hypothetical protein
MAHRLLLRTCLSSIALSKTLGCESTISGHLRLEQSLRRQSENSSEMRGKMAISEAKCEVMDISVYKWQKNFL